MHAAAFRPAPLAAHTCVTLLGTLLAAAALAAGPTGSLTPVARPAGCIVPKYEPATISCTRVHELGFAAVLTSRDGRNLYTLGGIDERSAIAVMRRDPRTGGVRQLAGRAGCLVADWTGHGRFARCAPAHLNNPTKFVLTPDGRELVYLNGAGRYPLNAYKRSPKTGALSPVDCCGPVRGVACPSEVATSPDGRNVYVTSVTCTGHGLSILVRDPSSGRLTQPVGKAGCVQRIAADGCARAPTLSFSPSGIAVTRDGAEVYVEANGGLFLFARNRARGTLTFRACYVAVAKSPCAAFSQLWLDAPSFFDFTIAPDGRNVYVAATPGRIVVLARSPSGQLSQLPPPRGCVTATGAAGRCIAAPALRGNYFELTFSADGRTVYAGRGDGFVVLNRDRTDGSLSQLPGRYGLVRLSTSTGQNAPSPDRFLYVATTLPQKGGPGQDAYGLRVFRRTR